MDSTFTWLDFSEAERRRMLDVVSAFQERDTRDELGIGVIRDAFADLLFPGTSTIQTRAKYFLLVPWVYGLMEQKRIPSNEIARRARAEEISLIDVLSKSDDMMGVIGIEARRSLQRLPSNIYWTGLGVWGIRLFSGSQSQYHRYLDHFYRTRRQARTNDDGEPVDGSYSRNWHAGLPQPPRGFPYEASLRLSKDEAEYLRERVMARAGGTLIAFMVDRDHWTGEVGFPWEHPKYAEFPQRVREQLEYARLFSETMHGAAILYNFMLARLANREELAEQYKDDLGQWGERLEGLSANIEKWDLRRFWEIVSTEGASVSAMTRAFVESWLRMVIPPTKTSLILDSKPAHRLIHDRERQLKRGLARLDNARARELWSGASGLGRLNYRWGVAQTIASDIVESLI